MEIANGYSWRGEVNLFSGFGRICFRDFVELLVSKRISVTYSVILSALSNKTNLILGFSSPLKAY